MTIQPDDVMALVLEAVPSFEEEWLAHVQADNAAEHPGERRLGYLDVSAVLDHIAGRAADGDTTELAPLLAVVERLHLEGDAYVRELATVGYLEDLQGYVARGRLDRDLVLRLLGPESLRWWRGLDRFWDGGSAGGVTPVD